MVAGMVEGERRHHSLFAKTQGQIRSIDIEIQDGSTESQAYGATLKKRQHTLAGIEIIHQLAGPIAEAKFLNVQAIAVIIESGRDDWEHAKLIAADVVRTDEELSSLLEQQELEVRKIFMRPGVWKAVQTLADELLKKHSLNWAEVISIIADHTGEAERPEDILYK